MKTSTMMSTAMPSAPVGKAWEEVSASFDRFCLAAGIETLGAMMEADAEVACGPRHSRSEERRGHRWGRTAGKIGFHAGRVAIERPRVRGLDAKELPLASWEQAVDEDWLGQWAMNLMLINVSTRKYKRAVRLPEVVRALASKKRSIKRGNTAVSSPCGLSIPASTNCYYSWRYCNSNQRGRGATHVAFPGAGNRVCKRSCLTCRRGAQGKRSSGRPVQSVRFASARRSA
jgi:hypothetical protein